ncbi:MAG: GNAT family N-acetyltransferase [Alphaproteobacteria bacterium]
MQKMDADMPDYGDPGGDDFAALSRDRFPIRSMTGDDLGAIIAIDRKLTGRDRRDYYQAKHREMMDETGVRVSLVAEVDGRPVGYIMARVDYGEFGRTEPAAVIDTIGVEPGLGHKGIGAALLSQLLANLDALHVERVRTAVTWNNFSLLGFLARHGFAPAQQLALGRPADKRD